jgi:hypothetical protein
VLTTMDEETFLDDEIYDDDGEYHPVDDVMHGVDARPALLPSANDDDDDDADLDIANLGTHFTSLDIAPASCFTPAHLSSLAGCELHNLHAHTFIEMRADAVEEDLSSVGRLMPGLAEARMNASIVPTMRAFGSTFQQMKVLWLSRSELRDLSGIASLVSLTEAYLSFNDVTDVSPLSELDFLTTLDLEGNRVADSDAPEYLNMCPCLTELSLEGNPLARTMGYRNKVCCAVKRLLVLDDRPVTESDRVAVTESESGDSESDGETETTATKTDAARARQPETIDEPAEYESRPRRNRRETRRVITQDLPSRKPPPPPRPRGTRSSISSRRGLSTRRLGSTTRTRSPRETKPRASFRLRWWKICWGGFWLATMTTVT